MVGRPEVMTLSCGSGNLHDKRNRCFAACYKCLLRPWSNAGRKTDVSFHAMFSKSYTQTHTHTHRQAVTASGSLSAGSRGERECGSPKTPYLPV